MRPIEKIIMAWIIMNVILLVFVVFKSMFNLIF